MFIESSRSVDEIGKNIQHVYCLDNIPFYFVQRRTPQGQHVFLKLYIHRDMHPLNPCHLGDEFWYISSQWAGNSIN